MEVAVNSACFLYQVAVT